MSNCTYYLTGCLPLLCGYSLFQNNEYSNRNDDDYAIIADVSMPIFAYPNDYDHKEV